LALCIPRTPERIGIAGKQYLVGLMSDNPYRSVIAGQQRNIFA